MCDVVLFRKGFVLDFVIKGVFFLEKWFGGNFLFLLFVFFI